MAKQNTNDNYENNTKNTTNYTRLPVHWSISLQPFKVQPEELVTI